MRIAMPLRSESGFSTVIVIAVLAVTALATMAVLDWEVLKTKTNSRANNSAVVDQIRQKLVGAVLSPQAWSITQGQNPAAFAALPGTEPLLNIYLTDVPTPYYSSAVGSAGFDIHGVPCNQYNANNGNDNCPYRYEIRLVNRSFQSGNWIDSVRFTLRYKPADQKYTLKTDSPRFSFSLVRNLDSRSMETPCLLLGGVFNQDLVTCSVTFKKERACGAGSSYRGPSSDVCSNVGMAPTSCPSPQFVKGFNDNGAPICGTPL